MLGEPQNSTSCEPCVPYVVASAASNNRGDACAAEECAPGHVKVRKVFEGTGIEYAFCVPEGDRNCLKTAGDVPSPNNPNAEPASPVKYLPYVVGAVVGLFLIKNLRS